MIMLKDDKSAKSFVLEYITTMTMYADIIHMYTCICLSVGYDADFTAVSYHDTTFRLGVYVHYNLDHESRHYAHVYVCLWGIAQFPTAVPVPF